MQEKNNKKLDTLTVYIINALSDSELYGSEIDDKINELSNNTFKVKQATLYNALKKCEQKGIITSYWKDGDIGGKRHYYLLTDEGKELLINNKVEIKQNSDFNQDNQFEFFNSDEHVNKNKAFWNNQYLSNNNNDNQSNPENKIENINVDNEIDNSTTIWKENDLRIENNDVILSSTQDKPKVNIQNTDIDYKNILGELYISDNRNKIEVKPELVNDTKQEIQESIKLEQHQSIEEKTQKKNIQKIESNILNTTTREDLKIESDFSNYGIKVKVHDKASNLDLNSKEYYKVNKLNFFVSLICILLFAIEIVISYHITKSFSIGSGSQLLPYLIIGLISLLIPISLGVIYILNPHKKMKNNFDFKQSLLVRLLISIILVVFVISICFLAGMNNLNQIKYIYFWLIPTLISVDIILETVIRKLLLLTKEFDA